MAAGGRSTAAACIAGLALLCAPTGAGAAADPTTAPDKVTGWSLAWADDFETIDTRRWHLKDDTYSSNEDSFLQASNCSIDTAGADRRALRLQGRKQTIRKWGQRWDYTSCYATTEGKYALPDYFRAEVRAKVPMEQGMWAAPLWFRPADGSGGEIDLAETLGGDRPRRATQTIHTDYGSGHEQSSYRYPFRKVGDPEGTGWHTYTIEKVPGRITMWVDAVQTAQWSTGDPEWFTRYYETGKRWQLRINLQIGGSWGGPPDAGTDWAADRTAMLVDHVYVWTPTVLSQLPVPPLGGTEGERSTGVPESEPTGSSEVPPATTAGEGTGPWAPRAVQVRGPDWLSAALASPAPDVSWTPSSTGEGITYEVFRDDKLIATTARTWYDDPSAVGGMGHSYAVRAKDATGNVSGLASP